MEVQVLRDSLLLCCEYQGWIESQLSIIFGNRCSLSLIRFFRHFLGHPWDTFDFPFFHVLNHQYHLPLHLLAWQISLALSFIYKAQCMKHYCSMKNTCFNIFLRPKPLKFYWFLDFHHQFCYYFVLVKSFLFEVRI